MSRLIRHQFLGSWFLFWLLCITGIGIPFAILYLIDATVRIEDDIPDADQFIAAYKSGTLRKQ